MTDKGVKVRTTADFKLKDKLNRQFRAFNLEKQFGFRPEVIIIEKVHGKSNTIRLRAVLTPEEIKKESTLKK